MTEAKKKKWAWFEKLKGVKHIEIVVVLIFAAVAALVVFGNFGSGGEDQTSTTGDLQSYAQSLEARMAEVLGQIEGAGKVSVLLWFESGSEIVPAYSEDVTDNGTTTTEKKTLVLVGGKPVILTEITPKVGGVVIVAEGADNVKVKLELLKAVNALLKVDAADVEIFTMQKS